MTCYICLEDCESESPCQCKAKVHIKCLMEYSIATKTSECSICKQRMEQIEALALLHTAVHRDYVHYTFTAELS